MSHDVSVEPDTLELLLAHMEADERIGILAPNVGGAGQILGTGPGIEYREWVSGTCLLLRRNCVEEIGMFDTGFHSYVEDADLGFRANDGGWLVGRLRGARATERGSAIGSSRARREIVANGLLLTYKRTGVRGLLRSASSYARSAARSLLLSLLPRRNRQAHRRLAWEQVLGLASGLLRVAVNAPRDSGNARL